MMPGGSSNARETKKNNKDPKNTRSYTKKGCIAGGSQSTLDGKITKKVSFTEEDKAFRERILVELRKLRQEALEIE